MTDQSQQSQVHKLVLQLLQLLSQPLAALPNPQMLWNIGYHTAACRVLHQQAVLAQASEKQTKHQTLRSVCTAQYAY